MEAKERNAKMRKNRIENGLCKECGMELDTEGTTCTKCREKRRTLLNDTRKWYSESGICPRCRINSILGYEKNCPECRAYAANLKTIEREKDRESYNEKQRVYQKKIYEERKRQGICTRCGNRKALNGSVQCGICKNKQQSYRMAKYGVNVGNKRSERINKGICYFCDKPLKDGYKVCEYHYELNLKKLNNEKCKYATEQIKKGEATRIKYLKAKKENNH